MTLYDKAVAFWQKKLEPFISFLKGQTGKTWLKQIQRADRKKPE